MCNYTIIKDISDRNCTGIDTEGEGCWKDTPRSFQKYLPKKTLQEAAGDGVQSSPL